MPDEAGFRAGAKGLLHGGRGQEVSLQGVLCELRQETSPRSTRSVRSAASCPGRGFFDLGWRLFHIRISVRTVQECHPHHDCCCHLGRFLLLVQSLTLTLSPSLLPPWMLLASAIADPNIVTIAPSFDCYSLLKPLFTFVRSPLLLLPWIFLALCALVDPIVTAIAAVTLAVSCFSCNC